MIAIIPKNHNFFSLDNSNPYFVLKLHKAMNKFIRSNPSVLGPQYILWGHYKRSVDIILPNKKRSRKVIIEIIRVYDKNAKANHTQQTFGVYLPFLVPYFQVLLPVILQLLQFYEKHWDLKKVQAEPFPDHYPVPEDAQISKIIKRFNDEWRRRLISIDLQLPSDPETGLGDFTRNCISAFKQPFMQTFRPVSEKFQVPTQLFCSIDLPLGL